MKSTCSNKRQRGTQLVEFAIVLPLLVFIVFAVIEAGVFIRAHQVINNAAREGARMASNGEAREYVDTISHSNALGIVAACHYLNAHKRSFPGWGGNTSCGDPFSIVVETVPAGDADALVVTQPDSSTVELPSTRAIVTYRYEFKYVPLLAYFAPSGRGVTLKARAQFRNLY